MLRGFLKSENPNEYVKGNWTVRWDTSLMEVFNDPEKTRGVYYSGPLDLLDLESILDEIENFEFNLASELEN